MNPNYKVIAGSYMYGTNVQSSDQDIRGWYLPSDRHFFGSNGAFQMKCTCEDYHINQCSGCDAFDRCVDTVATLEAKLEAVEERIAELEAYIKANALNSEG